jgi:CxxC-x17-CxxC domain-containing protein
MKDFNRGGGGRFSGPSRFDNNRSARPGDRSGRPSMHSAVCADCGQSCEVPFKPTGDKPVYCSSCFGKKAGFDNSRFERRDSERPSFNRDDRRESARPSFNRDDRGDRSNLASRDGSKQQFDMLNAKLDNILRLLTVKPVIDKTFEKTVKEEQPIIKEVKKIVKEVKAKKVVAPKKVAKKTVAKKKK